MRFIGEIDGYKCYQVRDRAQASHEDDCVYITSSGDAYMWRTRVGSVNLATGEVYNFAIPTNVATAVKLYRGRKLREASAIKTKQEYEERKAQEEAASPEDFFERIGAEIDALLDSVQQEEKREVFKYEFI